MLAASSWIRFALALPLLFLSTAPLPAAEPEPITPTEKIDLLAGDGLPQFYTWLLDTKREDPRRVFTVKDGVLHISGDGLGCITTNKAFRNYHLVAEFKFGEKTFGG